MVVFLVLFVLNKDRSESKRSRSSLLKSKSSFLMSRSVFFFCFFVGFRFSLFLFSVIFLD
jgi:hypothetical protein